MSEHTDTCDVRATYPVLWAWWEGRTEDLIGDLARALDGEQSGEATISEAVTLLGSRLLVELERLYDAGDNELALLLTDWAEGRLDELWEVLGQYANERPQRVERRCGRRAADQTVFEGWLRELGDGPPCTPAQAVELLLRQNTECERLFQARTPPPRLPVADVPPPLLTTATPAVSTEAPPALTAGALIGHHIATPARPLPGNDSPPIVWIVAQNGTFKRGAGADLEIVIQTDSAPACLPGLAALQPSVRWSNRPQRPLGDLLRHLLDDARHAVGGGLIVRPIERQYFIVWRGGTARLIAPQAQRGTATRLSYEMPQQEPILCDIHSHHEMPAMFSETDDRDDLGLSVAVVIGRLFTQPELLCRLCVYGHRQIVPAAMVFGHLGPFRDVYQEDVCRRW